MNDPKTNRWHPDNHPKVDKKVISGVDLGSKEGCVCVTKIQCLCGSRIELHCRGQEDPQQELADRFREIHTDCKWTKPTSDAEGE